MRGNVVSGIDPFIMVEDTTAAAANSNTVGKTLYTAAISSPTVLLIAGQSNVANSAPTAYTPTNTTVYNINPYNGAIYKAVDPLLGCSTQTVAGNFSGRLADKLINAGTSTSVIIANVAIDGTTVSQWTDASSNFGSRVRAVLARLSARGFAPSAILWGQGEGDHGTSQVSYTASLNSLITVSRNAGYSGPWFIAQQTWLSGAFDLNVRAAQSGIVNHGLGIWAGPDADGLDASNRQVDNTHFNDTGADAYAGLWKTALHAYGAPF